MPNMTEEQVALLISSLTASIPGMIALYRTITENRAGVKTIDELIADADATYQNNINKLQSEP